MVKKMKKRTPTSTNTTEAMDEFLKSLDLYRKPIAKDGSCLFRAVAEQVFSCQAKHVQVRRDCIEYLRKHRKNFEAFVEGPFDHHLYNLQNPKEWAGQVEISALSHMYKCDFVVYQDVFQPPTNVTENAFDNKILLCFSNGNHYDSVYPSSYQKAAAMCQSLVYNFLYEKVFPAIERKESSKKTAASSKKQANQGGALDHRKQNGDIHANEETGDGDDGWTQVKSRTKGRQNRPAETAPDPPEQREDPRVVNKLQWEIKRSLDPEHYRNVELEIWDQNRYEQQTTDLGIAANIQFQANDRIIVRSLPNNNRQYAGIIHEVLKDNTCIVYIPGLREKHQVPLSNLKLDQNVSGTDNRSTQNYRELSGYHKKTEDSTTSPESINSNDPGNKDDPKRRRRSNKRGGGSVRTGKGGEAETDDLNQYNRSFLDDTGQRRKFGRRNQPRPRKDEKPTPRNQPDEDVKFLEELQEKDPAAFPALPTQTPDDKANSKQTPAVFWSQLKSKPPTPTKKPGKTILDDGVANLGPKNTLDDATTNVLEQKTLNAETATDAYENENFDNDNAANALGNKSVQDYSTTTDGYKGIVDDHASNALGHEFESLTMNDKEVSPSDALLNGPDNNDKEIHEFEPIDQWTDTSSTLRTPFVMENAKDVYSEAADSLQNDVKLTNGTMNTSADECDMNDCNQTGDSTVAKDTWNGDLTCKTESISDVQNDENELPESLPSNEEFTTDKVEIHDEKPAETSTNAHESTIEQELGTVEENFESKLKPEAEEFVQTGHAPQQQLNHKLSDASSDAKLKQTKDSSDLSSDYSDSEASTLKQTEAQQPVIAPENTTPMSQPTPTQTPSWTDQYHQPVMPHVQSPAWAMGGPTYVPSSMSVDSNGQDLPKDVKTLQFFFNMGLNYYQSLQSPVQFVYPSYYPSLPEQLQPTSQHVSTMYPNQHLQATTLTGGSPSPDNSSAQDRTNSVERSAPSYPYPMSVPFQAHQPFMMPQATQPWQTHHSPGQMHGVPATQHFSNKNLDQRQNQNTYNPTHHHQPHLHHQNNQQRHQGPHKGQGYNKRFPYNKHSRNYHQQNWPQQIPGSSTTHYDSGHGHGHGYHPTSSQSGSIPTSGTYIAGMEYAERMGLQSQIYAPHLAGNPAHVANASHGSASSHGGYQN